MNWGTPTIERNGRWRRCAALSIVIGVGVGCATQAHQDRCEGIGELGVWSDSIWIEWPNPEVNRYRTGMDVDSFGLNRGANWLLPGRGAGVLDVLWVGNRDDLIAFVLKDSPESPDNDWSSVSFSGSEAAYVAPFGARSSTLGDVIYVECLRAESGRPTVAEARRYLHRALAPDIDD